jgi:phosphoserine phosphatase
MRQVATLVCDSALAVLTAELAARASKALTNPAFPQWLDPGVAVDIEFVLAAPESARTVTDRLRAALEGAPADVFVQAEQGRRKKLLLADMDSTMIGQEAWLAQRSGKKVAPPPLGTPESRYGASRDAPGMYVLQR